MLPFKAFSAYANYPFTLDTDSDETSSSSDDDVAAMMMDVVVPPTPDALSTKAHRTALTSHEREVRLLELERSFAYNFANQYKDLPALVHTYGFALQCLVNVGVRGSESIRTRVVEAGVLGVVARILGGFLDYRTQERDKRVRMLVAAHDEKEKENQSSSSSDKEASSAAKADRRERHSSRMTSGESDTTAVLSMSTRRERRDRERGDRGERTERERERDATQALALANAQVQLAAINQQFQSQRQQQYALQQQQLFGVNPPTTNVSATNNNNNAGISLVAGMPAPAPVNANISNAVSTTPRQTRSAAVQALLNSSTEIPTLANPPRQYTSSIVPPISMRTSPPRRSRSSGSSTPSSVLNHPMNPSSSSSTMSSTNLTTSSVAAVNSLIAAEHIMIPSHINRTNTPDTIASIDEVQEFSDVNQDENESTTSSGHENEDGVVASSAGEGGRVMMDVIDASSLTEVEAQSTSAMMIASTVLSNPASRSVSRNRINANVLAQHRPVPPPSSMLRDEQEQQHRQQDMFISAVQPVLPQGNNEDNMNVQAPTMLGDVTIKLEHMPTSSSNEAMDEGADSDVVMERDNDREDHESTDDTGTSASPVSRPHSSQHSSRHHLHHHYLQHAPRHSASSHRLHQQQVPFLPRSGSASSFDSNAPTAPAGAAAISGSTAVSSGGMQMDSETTPVSRPIPLRRASSSAAMAAAAATPRNAYTSTTTASLHVPAVPSQPTSSATSSSANSARSSTSTTRPPHTSTHVHLRLRPELQQSASTNPSVIKDGSVHLLLNYGPLMDHYIKEEDVLHCLHLLAYLSKYPHVRAVFHDPENEICRPPSASAASEDARNTSTGDASMVSNSLQQTESGNRGNCCSCARKKLKFGEEGVPVSDNGGAATSSSASAASLSGAEDSAPSASAASSTSAGSACHGHCHAHAEQAGEPRVNTHSRSTSSGSQKHGHPCCANEEDEEAESLARARAMATMPAKDRKPALEPSRPPRSTANNVFSLVEQYTFRPSSPADRSMRLGTDIQYWAGVIMRNACRKDELRGGIRQCANMGCGVWERFPREFAKCRRCRKAKYCSKGCQRRAWQAGHR